MSGQPKRPAETPRKWLRYAQQDLGVVMCADYDADLGMMMAEGAVLNEFIVAGRYPGDIAFEEIGRAQAEEALGAARRIRARVMNLMGAE